MKCRHCIICFDKSYIWLKLVQENAWQALLIIFLSLVKLWELEICRKFLIIVLISEDNCIEIEFLWTYSI